MKCVVENVPDLVWRKVVQAKSSEQAAAIVALKALHIQYDQAVGHAQQQKEQAAAAREQAAAAEEKRKNDEAQLPEKVFGQVKGIWRRTEQQEVDLRGEPYASGPLPPIIIEEILDFQSLNGRTIATQLAEDENIGAGADRTKTLSSLSFQVTPPNLLVGDGEVHCVQRTTTHSRGKHKGQTETEAPCGVIQLKAQIKLLDSDHLRLTRWYQKSGPISYVFVRSF